MRKFFSIAYSQAAFNFAMLLLRVVTGVLMMNHGYRKLVTFSQRKETFMNFLGMGSTVSLSLTIFAEFFCALFIIIGLFTRLSAIPLVIAMTVALFVSNQGDFFGDGEMSALFLCAFCCLLLLGPGRISVDGMSSK
jgi:putative oxidoreductase